MTRDELAAAYPIGCRVVATARFREQFPRSRSRTAVVVGYSRFADLVRVRVDGCRSVQRFHRHFWEPIV